MMGNLIADAAKALNLTSSQLMVDLKSGESLATIASQHGSSASALESTLLADAKSSVQSALADGRLTTAEASQIESRLGALVDRLVTATPGEFSHAPGAWRHSGTPGGLMGSLMSDAAETLHVSTSELESDLQSGKTLATVAKDQGVSVSQLESTLTQDLKSEMQNAVKDGRVSASLASELESHLSAMVSHWVDGTGFHAYSDGWGQ